MIEAIRPKVTLATAEIQDGDIITVQKSLSDKEYVEEWLRECRRE